MSASLPATIVESSISSTCNARQSKNIEKKKRHHIMRRPVTGRKRQMNARSPKIAVPTRTMVDPSATASSMSPVMPIDSSRQDCVPARRIREYGRGFCVGARIPCGWQFRRRHARRWSSAPAIQVRPMYRFFLRDADGMRGIAAGFRRLTRFVDFQQHAHGDAAAPRPCVRFSSAKSREST